MIEIKNLTKRFGPITAVDDLSFRVQPGEVLGFLGPNGAGKSTTMKMVTGFLAPTSGAISVCGHDVLTDAAGAQAAIGYLPEGAPLYPDMNPRSMMRFVGRARGMAPSRLTARIDEVCRLVHLEAVMDQRIETLSKGFKRRVGLALAILNDPEVLILDEPTDGLDPNQKHEVRELIRTMSAGKVIVLSTHILEEVEAVCTRAMIVAEGSIKFDGTPAELRGSSRFAGAIEIAVASDHAEVAQRDLAELGSVSHIGEVVEAEGETRFVVFPATDAPLLEDVQRVAAGASWSLVRLAVDRGRMDDVFRTVTTGQSAQGA